MIELSGLTTDLDGTGPLGLTDKQCEVLDLVLEHKSNKEIARMRLGTSRRGDTARTYANLRGTCAKPTGMGAQVAFDRSFGEDRGEAGEDDLLLLEDVGVGGPYPFWQEPQGHPTGFRDFSVPESLWSVSA